MKAIKTKYIGPSNVRGSRCKAIEPDGKSITLSWDNALNSDEMHKKTAYALRDKLGWPGELIGGALKDCMVWVFTS